MELTQKLRMERDLARHEGMRDWETPVDEHLALSLNVHLVVEPQLFVDVGRHLGHPRWHLRINKWSLLCQNRVVDVNNTNKLIPNYPLFSQKAIGHNAGG